MEKYYTFKIKRFLPEETPSVRWDEFRIKLNRMERIIDGLIKIKETRDGTLTFRKSCAHGVCGSCAMKINGKNRLACQTLVKDMPEVIEIEPLPALPVIKDLVVDMTLFFEKNDRVLPYLINDEPPPERERLQSPDDQHKILESITCIMCGSCTTSCPVFWADKEYLGPSALLKAYRFIFDTRDRATQQRLEKITGEHGVWRCHSIFNCVDVCPKEIDITKHILKLKRQAVKKGFTGGQQ
ncbi:succinate dehydrogenase iron-sulfur subunit [Thermodesulfovibrio thiophilus]|uniref:succinate dehydrogenase iron-sulfur subunit n=1 Tax=Thermodesulfovibrio thiophilus TaxID=340095 RepID=UPI0017F155F4|nr:succinate dehydrogenase iron-sulfur subunit [Thermodesulfovibrio thiophilus]HHW21043.1 succinate dehydrogenase iron-sulfur subunit [Thermodesulfovibrio thiophilus]